MSSSILAFSRQQFLHLAWQHFRPQQIILCYTICLATLLSTANVTLCNVLCNLPYNAASQVAIKLYGIIYLETDEDVATQISAAARESGT